jgi:hypothetical protein
VGALCGVQTFFLIKHVAPTTAAAMGMMVIMMPFFFLAMYEKNGQYLEVILGHLIEATFIRPKQRPYKTDNNYSAQERYEKAQEEVDKIVQASIKREEKRSGHAKASD